MDIYEMTFEKITHILKNADSRSVKFDVPADMDDDDALDMFADDFDKKDTEKGDNSSKSKEAANGETGKFDLI